MSPRITIPRAIGAIFAAAALIFLCVTTLNQSTEGVATLEHAQRLAKLHIEKIPLSQIPFESELETLGPEWKLKSDQVIGEETEDPDNKWIQPEADMDDDIDSPIHFEIDHRGNQFVPLVSNDIQIDETENKQIRSDVGKSPCGPKQKICVTKRQCQRRCEQKCKPIKTKPCTMKLHCRCWCKCGSKVMKKHKCIIFKKSKRCVTDWRYKCRRRCKKFCKNIPKCYCCKGSVQTIKKRCYKKCRRITMYKRKCGSKCSCITKRCAKTCEIYCLPKK